MNKFQVKEYIHNSCNSTEQLFHKLHKYYPEEIYIKLRQLGYSNNSAFAPIQNEMDRLFKLQKQESEFQTIGYNPFN